MQSFTAQEIGCHLILGVKDEDLLIRHNPYFQGIAAKTSLSETVYARNPSRVCVCVYMCEC